MISKIQVTLDVLNALKSKKTLKKFDESKSHKTCVSGIFNPNKLLINIQRILIYFFVKIFILKFWRMVDWEQKN